MLSEGSHLTDQILLMELDGELPTSETNSVRAHLDSCWKCRARRQELERSITDFMQVYQQEPDPQLPPAAGPRAMLRARLAQSAEAERKKPRPWLAGWDAPVWGAALCLFALLVFGLTEWQKREPIPGMDRSQALGNLVISTPNTLLTPGATILLSRNMVCSQANVKNKEVPAPIRRLVFKEYGLAKARPDAYEVDYLVTPALGGSDDIRNLWPHSYSSEWNARVKDALEDRLRDMVCDGRLELSAAQRDIAGNWIDAYKKYFHTDRPLPEHSNR